MPTTPKWLKATRAFCLLGLPAMAFNCWLAWTEEVERWDQIFPTALILLACTHLAFRAPYKRWSFWEAPLIMLSLASAAYGAFLFKPEGEEFSNSLQTMGGSDYIGYLVLFFMLAVSGALTLWKVSRAK